MKKLLIIMLIIAQAVAANSKNIEPAPDNKSVVYFIRASGAAMLINFTFFDGEKVIGRLNGSKYMRYECEPGEHLLWARSENKSFVEANLEAGKIYVIDVLPKMGGIKASVQLVPVNPKNYKMKRLQKLVSRKSPEIFIETQLKELQNTTKELVVRGMEKYNKIKKKGRSIPKLKADMNINEEDLVYVEKK